MSWPMPREPSVAARGRLRQSVGQVRLGKMALQPAIEGEVNHRCGTHHRQNLADLGDLRCQWQPIFARVRNQRPHTDHGHHPDDPLERNAAQSQQLRHVADIEHLRSGRDQEGQRQSEHGRWDRKRVRLPVKSQSTRQSRRVEQGERGAHKADVGAQTRPEADLPQPESRQR